MSSSPVAISVKSSVGASASAATLTSSSPDTVAVSSPSVVVTDTSSVKSASEFSGGVIVRPVNWSGVNVAEPSLMVISLPAPSFSTAPSGMSEIVIETDSEPSASVETAVMFSAIGWSSVPAASVVVRSASSATASTLIEIVSDTDAVSPPFASVDVAVTERSKVPEKSSGGVMVRLSSRSGSSAISVDDIVQDPSPLSVPAERTAPSGTPVMVIERDSEPSTSVRLAEISIEIAASSEPVAVSARVSDGASASASTCTSNSTGSSSSARTDNAKSSSESAGGIIAKFSKSVTVYEPSSFSDAPIS